MQQKIGHAEVAPGHRRFVSIAIDVLIQLLICGLIAASVYAIVVRYSVGDLKYGYTFIILIPLVYSLFELFTNASIGKVITGLRIRDVYGDRPNWQRAGLRWLLKMSPLYVIWFGFDVVSKFSAPLWGAMLASAAAGVLAMDILEVAGGRDAWHDRLAMTRVAACPEKLSFGFPIGSAYKKK